MKERLVSLIRREGPLPFERFMEMALYDREGGFFSAGPLRSHPGGDFVTSPEVSPAFGETLAGYVTEEFRRLGEPSDFAVVEVGAGSGSLLEPLLAALSFPVRAAAVEVSGAARATLAERFPQAEVWRPEEVPDRLAGVVFANEVADNLPAAMAVREDGGWSERRVGEEDGELVWTAAPVRAEVGGWVAAYAGEVPPGGTAAAQLAAGAWLSEWADRLTAGSLLICDFGGTAAELAGRRPGGVWRTFRAHRTGLRLLENPGQTDIAADVNFTALAAVAQARGLECQLLSQRDFLTAWGLPARISAWKQEDLELARTGETLERLRLRHQITGAAALLDPAGLGGFQVLTARRPTR